MGVAAGKARIAGRRLQLRPTRIECRDGYKVANETAGIDSMTTLTTQKTDLPESPEAVRVGYTIRWKQRGFNGETAGKRTYDSLEEVMALCERVNARWNGEITQWPVKLEINNQGFGTRVAEGLRHLIGLE